MGIYFQLDPVDQNKNRNMNELFDGFSIDSKLAILTILQKLKFKKGIESKYIEILREIVKYKKQNQ